MTKSDDYPFDVEAMIRAASTPPYEVRRKENVIYFISVGLFIKIGTTTDWRSRISTIQSSNPYPVEILLILGRPPAYEQTAHRKFKKHHVRGEWFKDHPDIREFIDELKHECWYQAKRSA